MAILRKILHLAPDAATVLQTLVDDTDSNHKPLVKAASFENLYHGGCGSGSFTVIKDFDDQTIEPGDHIKCVKVDPNTLSEESWYLGRIEELTYDYPQGCVINTFGLIGYFNDVVLGGVSVFDARAPHAYARDSSYFVNDPDFGDQSIDIITSQEDNQGPYSMYVRMVERMIQTYLTPDIPVTIGTIEPPVRVQNQFDKFVFRGNETLHYTLKQLALQLGGMSYGVDADGRFFLRNRNYDLQKNITIGVNGNRMQVSKARSMIINRLHIIGDYIYPAEGDFYRAQFNLFDISSVNTYGTRKTVVHLPWIRTTAEAYLFAKYFFEIWAQPKTRYRVSSAHVENISNPWDGDVRIILPESGPLVKTGFPKVQYTFNPCVTEEITTEYDEREFPEPGPPERYELPRDENNNDPVESLTNSFQTPQTTFTWTDTQISISDGQPSLSQSEGDGSGDDTGAGSSSGLASSASGLTDQSGFSGTLTLTEGSVSISPSGDTGIGSDSASGSGSAGDSDSGVSGGDSGSGDSGSGDSGSGDSGSGDSGSGDSGSSSQFSSSGSSSGDLTDETIGSSDGGGDGPPCNEVCDVGEGGGWTTITFVVDVACGSDGEIEVTKESRTVWAKGQEDSSGGVSG